MGFCVLHYDKQTGSSPGLSQHIERGCYRDGKWVEWHPTNADESRTHLNRELISGDLSRDERITKRIKDALGSEFKPKKNQVRALTLIMSASCEDMQRIMDEGKFDDWCKSSIQWAQETHGEDNVVSAVLHMDEKTPHLHVTVVPIVQGKSKDQAYREKKVKEAEEKGIEQKKKRKYKKKNLDEFRLCAADVMARTKLKSYQTTYAEAVADYGLTRGIDGSIAKHIDVNDWYKSLVTEVVALEKEINEKKNRVKELSAEIKDKENKKELIQMDVDYLADEHSKLDESLKDKRIKENELGKDIEQLSAVKESKEQTIALIKELGSKAIDTISGKSKREKEEMKKQLRDEKKQHTDDVAELKAQHENDVAELKAQHENAVAELKDEHEKKLNKAKSELKEEKKEHAKTQMALDKALTDNSQDELKRQLKETKNELATTKRNETTAKNQKMDAEHTLRLKEMEHEDFLWLVDTCAKCNLPSNVIRPLIEGKEVETEVHGETRRLKFKRREFYNTTASLWVKVKDMWHDFLSWYRRTAEQMKLRQSVSIDNTRKKGLGL